MTVVWGGRPIPSDAQLIPLNVPGDELPGLLAAARGATANLAARLDRFQGMHILIFDSPDIDRAAARLDAAGVGRGDVQQPDHPNGAADLTGVHALGARLNGRLVGIAHSLVHASTTSPDVCYLQDLFTAPKARGKGVARNLITAAEAWARQHGGDRLYWHTRQDNHAARRSTTRSPKTVASSST